MIISEFLWLVTVALIWGITNPLIKKGSKGVSTIKPKMNQSNFLYQLIAEFKYLFARWEYVLPLAINWLGSILFIWALGNSEISLVVPITNGLTFLFTFLTSKLLGDIEINISALCGIFLVVIGVWFCVASKI
eukprot:TRINITY_DN3952_c0_g1_i1.p1 TRINITY_DN3952_c0_g1~~TRINITY_DN3952_c0_g1_i1.p1  ORF type:complete len:133 (-),score=43.34 TRINITY_DN3952_c0_g1_i1:20-418(-)